MKYALLQYPHTNKRYEASLSLLSQKELAMLLQVGEKASATPIPIEQTTLGGLSLLTFDLDPSQASKLARVYRHSALFALFEVHDGNQLIPLMDHNHFYFSDDLSYILKYKGKTNEMFTDLLINIGVYASEFATDDEQPLWILDPMCGKGTTLFKALKYGYHSAGIEMQTLFYTETENYLKRYFQTNLMKHQMSKSGYHFKDGHRASKFILETADTKANYQAQNTRSVQMVNGDAKYAAEYFGKKKFHSIIVDLPYGVQHQAKNAKHAKGSTPANYASTEKVLDQALPGFVNTLKTGGTLVLAYNSQTLKKETLDQLMIKHQLETVTAPYLEGLSHWVEQAITRDIYVAKKTNLSMIDRD